MRLLLGLAALTVALSGCFKGNCGYNDCDADAGQFCCNESCSICAPAGGICTQQLCSN